MSGLGGCLKVKVNIVSRQNTRSMQTVSILWAHKFQSVTSVPTECGATSRNKRSLHTGRRLGCLADLKSYFGSFTKEVFAALAALGGTFGGGLGGLESTFGGGLRLVAW